MSTPLSGAVLIGRIRIRDATKWIAYRDAVPATLTPFDATLVARGSDALVLAGTTDETDAVVIRFPSLEAIEDWYASAAYQALIPLRDEAGDVVLVGYRI
jgi:uncharacterized protein (DUF1330 family)